MISQEAAVSSAHLQLDLFHGFTHQQQTQMEHKQPSYTCTHQRLQTRTDGQTHTHTQFIVVQCKGSEAFVELSVIVKNCSFDDKIIKLN